MAKLKLPKSLESVRADLQAAVRPCIALRAADKPSKDPAATRYGGTPLVPKGTSWPKGLTFIGQLNFAELDKVQGSLGLPKQGLLAFFYDLKTQPRGPAGTKGFVTVHTPKISDAVPLAAPKTGQLKPYFVKPVAVETIPTAEDLELRKWKRWKESMYPTYQRFYIDTEYPPLHQVGGNPFFRQSDARLGFEGKDDWQLVWSMRSDEDVVEWRAGGTLFLFGRKADLANGKLDQLRVHIELP